jgi:hypothetical protein
MECQWIAGFHGHRSGVSGLIMLCSSWDHPHRPGRPSMSIQAALLRRRDLQLGGDWRHLFNKVLCCGARNWESQKGKFFNPSTGFCVHQEWTLAATWTVIRSTWFTNSPTGSTNRSCRDLHDHQAGPLAVSVCLLILRYISPNAVVLLSEVVCVCRGVRVETCALPRMDWFEQHNFEGHGTFRRDSWSGRILGTNDRVLPLKLWIVTPLLGGFETSSCETFHFGSPCCIANEVGCWYGPFFCSSIEIFQAMVAHGISYPIYYSGQLGWRVCDHICIWITGSVLGYSNLELVY